MNDFTKKDADLFIATLLDVVKKVVKKGESVSFFGFGTFSKIKRKKRMGVNPSTGEKITIKARTVPKFKASNAWKDIC